LTDKVGIIEHARCDRPHRGFGYCTDDAGRLLAVASVVSSDPDAYRLATVALRFLGLAHDGGGSFRLRMGPSGAWTADAPSDDGAGRAIYGLGTAIGLAPWPDVRAGALELFEAAAGFRSTFPRALAYAVLGGVGVLDAVPDHETAHRLVVDAACRLPGPGPDPRWPWPEPRLSYANALIPEARLASAITLGDRQGSDEALSQLDWLIAEELRDGRFSFTPVCGRGPGEAKPAFDQQPIEAWAMADACARAYSCTGESHWADGVQKAASWFVGDNDSAMIMFDAETGGGFDGLEAGGVNRNQGAESTLAFVATMARAQAVRRAVQATPSLPAAARASSRRGTEAIAAPTQRSAAP
jgi:hypothetical protein